MTYRFHPLKPNLPIIDSDREIILRVTTEDCAAGEKDNPQACALALAAKAELKGLRQVEVLTNVTYFEFRDHVERFRNATHTAEMVRDFDRGGGVFVPGDYRFLPMNKAWTRREMKKKNATVGRPSTGEKPKAGRRQAQTAIINPRGQAGRKAKK